jgi:hypothetical protein
MRSTTHPVGGVVAMIISAVVVCVAGYWEFDQVDSGSLGAYVAIDKMSDGTIWLAYVNRDSAIRLAHKDSLWVYEDIDTAVVRPIPSSEPSWGDQPFAFDIGPNNAIGVVGLNRLAEHDTSGWSSEELPMRMRMPKFAYDSACRPSLTFADDSRQGCLGVKTDSGWDTSVVFQDASGYTWWFSLTRPAWRRGGNCALIEADVWSMGGLIDGYGVSLKRRDSGVWTDFGGLGGLDGGGRGLAALVDSSDSIHTFWSAADNYLTNKLVCDGVTLDGYTPWAAACLDDSGRVQCVWGRDGKLKFALVPEPAIEVRDISGLGWCDITTDALSQPVIAYCLDDGSIYVAHGIDVAGLGGEPRGAAVHARQSRATIVRGVLFLAQALGRKPQATSLLDISGRKVMDLHPGTNGVSSIAPGVYFVREGGGSREQGGVGVRKVVVAR